MFLKGACLTVSLALLPCSLSAGGVLRVGPTQTYATIQAAVDAAVSGDLILVDAGTYPAFVIDGKAISVMADGANFTVAQSPGAPAVAIRNIAVDTTATLAGLHLDYSEPSAPAIVVEDNDGAVRLTQLDIDPSADMVNSPVQAIVEVDDTATFWLIDSDVWTPNPRSGNTTSPAGANDGISGLQIHDSRAVVQNVKLLGYNNKVSAGTGLYAGDGVRMLGNSHIWSVDDYVDSPTKTRLRGGDGGQYGGNGLHLVGNPSNQARVNQCGRVAYDFGTGTVLNGGGYAIDNDGGIVSQGGGFTFFRLVPPCLEEYLAETSVDSIKVSPGGSVNVRIYTAKSRAFLTRLALDSVFTPSVPGFWGFGMQEFSAPTTTVVQTGTTTAHTPYIFPVAFPNLPGLIGWQMTFQSAIGPSSSNYNALGAPSLVVVTP